MHRVTAATSAAALILMMGASAVKAQSVAGDVQPGDWAYAAVQDLASKGLIKGYPPEGNFLGGRAVTRFEMAAIVDRVLEKIDEEANSGSTVTPQDLDEVKQLVDNYKVELTIIGGKVDQAQADIAKLQGQVGDLQTGLAGTQADVKKQGQTTDDLKKQVKSLADTAYTSNPKSKFNISGYIQMRGVFADNGDHRRFPQGTAAKGGSGVNGNYSQGGTQDGFSIRRARIKFSGAPTDNTAYAAQLDYSGDNGSSTPITVREAWGSYTFGDGSKIYPTVTAGQFSTPFGYVLPLSSAASLTPERPLAFNNGTNTGLFNNQEVDRGVQFRYGPKALSFTYATINGAGRNNENIDSHFDSLFRLAYASPHKVVNAGISYYDGDVYRTAPTLAAGQYTYPEPKKQLLGLDAQINLKNGIFVDGEYVKGTYESRSYFNGYTATSLTTDGYVKGNQVQGYYVWGGYTFHKESARPLTLGVDYDVFQRSTSAQDSPYNAVGGNNANGDTASGNSSYDDVNIGYGALYNLDKATRLRLWYDDPQKIAHAPGTQDPPKIGLTTAEIQVKF